MAPKTPKQLRDQIEKQNKDQPAVEDAEYTAEGKLVRTPWRVDFFMNLKRVTKPEK